MDKNILLLLLGLSASQLFGQEPKLMLPVGHSLGVATAVFSPDGKRIVNIVAGQYGQNMGSK